MPASGAQARLAKEVAHPRPTIEVARPRRRSASSSSPCRQHGPAVTRTSSAASGVIHVRAQARPAGGVARGEAPGRLRAKVSAGALGRAAVRPPRRGERPGGELPRLAIHLYISLGFVAYCKCVFSVF